MTSTAAPSPGSALGRFQLAASRWVAARYGTFLVEAIGQNYWHTIQVGWTKSLALGCIRLNDFDRQQSLTIGGRSNALSWLGE